MTHFALCCCLWVLWGTFAISTALKMNLTQQQLPYGPGLAASLPGIDVNATDDTDMAVSSMEMAQESDLSWWQSLDRNNTINCTCGVYGQSNDTERWEDEGIDMLNTYSWSVSLVSKGQSFAYCGGSLVNDRYVLTAASCVDGATASEVEVLIGTWPQAHMNYTEVDELNTMTALRRSVRRVILHPKYASVGIDYNIALLRLRAPVIGFGQERGFSPICLPKTSDIEYDTMNASSLVWRFSMDDETIIPIKRTEINSVIISKEECKAYKYNTEWERMPDTMVCAKTERPSNVHPYAETFACPGDAGGPLVVTVNGRKVQVGVDSWTPCFGRPEEIGVFTRITEFLPWINRHIAKDGRNCAN